MERLLFLISSTVTFSYGYLKIDLTKEKWFLINDTVALPTTIPTSVYTTLRKYNVIQDPYFGYNDVEYTWIQADNKWVYQTTFNVQEQVFGSIFARLKFLGLDTVATVYFNGKYVGTVDNMFSDWSFPLKHVDIQNVVSVFFVSPTVYATNMSRWYTKEFGYDVPPVSAPKVQHGNDHPNFIRKSQCSFSWDWGPSFPTIGVWKPTFIEVTQSVFLNDFNIITQYNAGSKDWNVNFDVIIDSYIAQNATVVYGFEQMVQRNQLTIKIGVQKIKLQPFFISDVSVKRWWPIGHGGQNLYEGFLNITDVDGTVMHKELKFGFRTIELIEEPIEHSDGLSFYFKVNSRPIFMKGANWIPADSFQENVTEAVLEDLLNSTRDANMNALRVWGGGIYEQDRFYELADEMGILIWQDLMFAVALYPVHQQFLESVEKEIRFQVQRLQHHPSIIAWSGNNENEAAIAQKWWPEVKTNRERLVADYGKLYVETIQPVIEEEDGTRPYLLSSPSNGNENKAEGYISENPQNSLYGDVHFYDYKNDCWNPATFPNPRFASEYGYQSYPSFESLKSVAPINEVFRWNSSFLYHRQHHAHGNKEIEDFIKQHYDLPLTSEETAYARYMIYLSQIIQATCVKYETEHYRRLQDNLINGEGHTMGALYWQLNDIWQAPSWASIEYGGKWKMLHYYAQNFFAPTAVSAYIKDNSDLHVYILRDHAETSEEFVINYSLRIWDSFYPLIEESVNVATSANNHSDEVFISAYLPTLKPSFVVVQLLNRSTYTIISETEIFTWNFTSDMLKDPKITINETKQLSATEVQLTMQAEQPAAFVWMESLVKGRFSKNGFLMYKKEEIIVFSGKSKIGVDEFIKSLQVTSLYDVYKPS